MHQEVTIYAVYIYILRGIVIFNYLLQIYLYGLKCFVPVTTM